MGGRTRRMWGRRSTEEAEEVVRQLNGQDVDGRVLRVNIANVDK